MIKNVNYYFNNNMVNGNRFLCRICIPNVDYLLLVSSVSVNHYCQNQNRQEPINKYFYELSTSFKNFFRHIKLLVLNFIAAKRAKMNYCPL